MSKDRPKHRIQAVADRTGVPAPTLRAWERRYGFPRPSRTESAYRLYSDRDVELVIAMRQLTEEGMSASEAARVTRGLLESRQQELKEAEPGDAYEAAAQAMVSAAMDLSLIHI